MAASLLARWPVTISYFDHAVVEKSGEQTPVYAITFELYENGVSRALLLDYGDFVLTGEMTSLELHDKDAAGMLATLLAVWPLLEGRAWLRRCAVCPKTRPQKDESRKMRSGMQSPNRRRRSLCYVRRHGPGSHPC